LPEDNSTAMLELRFVNRLSTQVLNRKSLLGLAMQFVPLST
jgi:hypothetical protein